MGQACTPPTTFSMTSTSPRELTPRLAHPCPRGFTRLLTATAAAGGRCRRSGCERGHVCLVQRVKSLSHQNWDASQHPGREVHTVHVHTARTHCWKQGSPPTRSACHVRVRRKERGCSAHDRRPRRGTTAGSGKGVCSCGRGQSRKAPVKSGRWECRLSWWSDGRTPAAPSGLTQLTLRPGAQLSTSLALKGSRTVPDAVGVWVQAQHAVSEEQPGE